MPKSHGGKRDGAGRKPTEIDLNVVTLVSRFTGDKFELADALGVSVDTIERRMQHDEAFRRAFTMGRARQRLRSRATQQFMANGYWISKHTGELRFLDEAPVGDDGKVNEKEWRLVLPNVISSIWNGKQDLGQSDKSILEMKYRGDPSNIKDDELLELAAEAFRVLGAQVPSGHLPMGKQRGVDSASDGNDDADHAADER